MAADMHRSERRYRKAFPHYLWVMDRFDAKVKQPPPSLLVKAIECSLEIDDQFKLEDWVERSLTVINDNRSLNTDEKIHLYGYLSALLDEFGFKRLEIDLGNRTLSPDNVRDRIKRQFPLSVKR